MKLFLFLLPIILGSGLLISVHAQGAPSASSPVFWLYEPKILPSQKEHQNRHVVWHDEFRGGQIDSAKWRFGASMSSSDCQYVNDRRTACVTNGYLLLRVWPSTDPTKRCLLPRGLLTDRGMAWKYGYVEMRAQVPFRRGAWSSFWMQSLASTRQANYLTEVDIFEVFSSTNALSPNLHKWAGEKHTKLPGEEQDGRGRTFRFESNEEAQKTHIYGFEWTPQKMSFFVDGVCYYSRSIEEKDDFDRKVLPSMKGFHDFMFLILNNEVFTPGHGWCPENKELSPETVYPIEYKIDWIRLWQNPTCEYLKILRP